MRTTKIGEIMNFLDVLNAATATLSDNKLSKKLGVRRQTVSTWRNNGSIPEDETLDKLAELTGIPVEKVYFASYADKVGNPMVAALLRNYSEGKIVADNNPN
jgi:transcriptional regulator with XRE-family HTH domain